MVANQIHAHLGLVMTKPVFGVSHKASFKPVSSATETSLKIKISLVAGLDKILLDKRITKALISLCGCAGWSALLLLQTPEDRFCGDEAHLSSKGSSCMENSEKQVEI